MNSSDIIFEDNHILVLNKLAGLLTQVTENCEDSLEQRAKNWLKEKYQKPGNVFLHVIHRLDKPVSGIVIAAKTSKALSRLNASMRSKEIKKTYLALVEGKLKDQKGTLENYLRHDDFKAFISSSNDKDAKFARLHYQVLKYIDGKSLVEVKLETGRYHQIRSQFSHIGFPIIGDAKYGSKSFIARDQIALHHHHAEMIHPVTKESLQFTAPLPAYLAI